LLERIVNLAGDLDLGSKLGSAARWGAPPFVCWIQHQLCKKFLSTRCRGGKSLVGVTEGRRQARDRVNPFS